LPPLAGYGLYYPTSEHCLHEATICLQRIDGTASEVYTLVQKYK